MIDCMRERILTAAKNKDWHLINLLSDFTETTQNCDPEIARIIGIAARELGREPFDPVLLSKSTRYLSSAWIQGYHDPEMVWLLADIWHRLGEYEKLIDLLSEYMTEVQDPVEYVEAGSLLAQILEIRNKDSEAVACHQKAVNGPGQKASPLVRFESYRSGHIYTAYGSIGEGKQWFTEIRTLWELLDENQQTFQRAMWFFQGAQATLGQCDHLNAVIELGEELVSRYQKVDPALTEEEQIRWLGNYCSILCDLIELYSQADLPEKVLHKLEQARESLMRLRDTRPCDPMVIDTYHYYLYRELQNLGYQCRKTGFYQDSICLFKEAVKLPLCIGPSYFMLAALTLETGGDKQTSLSYLRKSLDDIEWASDDAGSSLYREFSSDPAFQDVRNDPDFLDIVQGMSSNCLS